jgi:hypothetical protein
MQKLQKKSQPSWILMLGRVAWSNAAYEGMVKSARLIFRPFSLPDLLNERRQVHFEFGPGDQIDPGDLPKRRDADLGVAAGDGDKGRPIASEDFPDEVAAFRLRLLGDGTGVDHAEIGLRFFLPNFETGGVEPGCERGALRLIETASEGLE